MTEFQREFYMLLCMCGRSEEAVEYKKKIEQEKEEKINEQMGQKTNLVEDI